MEDNEAVGRVVRGGYSQAKLAGGYPLVINTILTLGVAHHIHCYKENMQFGLDNFIYLLGSPF